MVKIVKSLAALLVYFTFLVIENSLAYRIFPFKEIVFGGGFFFYLPFPILDIHFGRQYPLSLGIFLSLVELLFLVVLLSKSKAKIAKILTVFLLVNFVIILVLRFLEVREIIHSSYFSVDYLLR
jgi:hypothetical protein